MVEEGLEAVKVLELGPVVVLPWGPGCERVSWNSTCGSCPVQSGGVPQVLSVFCVGMTVSQPGPWEDWGSEGHSGCSVQVVVFCQAVSYGVINCLLDCPVWV